MAGTKRKKGKSKDNGSDKEAESSKKTKQDVKHAKSLNIPVDEGFKESTPVQVYINEEDGDIFDASLNQTNVGNNANKFYRLQLLQKDNKTFFAHLRWGRVGEFGQVKTIGPTDCEEASKTFKKKFKDKSGLAWEDRHAEPKNKKYTFIEKNYEEEDDDDGGSSKDKKTKKGKDDDANQPPKEEIPSKLPSETQSLIQLIFNQSHFNSVLESIGYNQDKLPLGKLGKGTLAKGFQHLKDLANLIKDANQAGNTYSTTQQQAIEDLTNKYYSTIPHVFGRNRPPMINNLDMLKKEVDMLDTLSDMEVASDIMAATEDMAKDAANVNLLDQRFEQLSMDEMTPLDSKTKEFKLLKDYLISTTGHSHNINYKLKDIFRITRRGENERFQQSEFAKVKNSYRCLLWHGSRTTNYGGILSQGLRIAPPEAPVSGYAFGKGIYLADISTKSANYCLANSSGGEGLLLLCEAELGDPMYEIISSDINADQAAKEANCIATQGIGQTVPLGWTDAGAVHESLKGCMMPDPSKKTGHQPKDSSAYLMYNEYICYNVAQVRLRYLLRFAM